MRRPSSATVVALDTSWEAFASGAFAAFKATALTVDATARAHYPHDALTFLHFDDFAHQLEREQLAALAWDENKTPVGINQHAALLVAREVLALPAAVDRRLIVLSAGEVTAHLEHGRFFCAYPPSHFTIEATVASLQACVAAGIAVSVLLVFARDPAYRRAVAALPGVQLIDATLATVEAAAVAAYTAGRPPHGTSADGSTVSALRPSTPTHHAPGGGTRRRRCTAD